ncbi:MAG: putative membrane protein YfcA [Granulosicoccus sp.]
MLETFLDMEAFLNLGTPLILGAVAIYFVAGFVKGTLGIGFPTAAISLMAQFTDARTAISLVIIPMIVTNAWQIWRNRQIKWVLSNFWRVLVLMVIFIALFTQVSSAVPVAYVTAFLGAFITVYAATTLYKPIFKFKQEYDSIAQVIAGTSAGIMGGIAGVWAPPILIYLSARGVTKTQFVATTGVLLFVGSTILFSGYWHAGMIGPSVVLISCFLLIPSMAGVILGERLRNRLSAQRFERLLLWFFLLMGLNLIRRALM